MKRIQLAVIAAIRDRAGRYLLTKRVDLEPKTKRFHDYWQFPGGGVEFGESPTAALQREMREEIGSEITILKLFPEVLTVIRDKWQGVFCVYLCELAHSDNKIKLNEEASEYAWLTPEEIAGLKSLPSTEDIVRLAQTL